MRKWMIICLALTIGLFMCPLISYGKTYAYFFFGREGSLIKIDTETNTVSKVTPKTPMNGSIIA